MGCNQNAAKMLVFNTGYGYGKWKKKYSSIPTLLTPLQNQSRALQGHQNPWQDPF